MSHYQLGNTYVILLLGNSRYFKSKWNTIRNPR